MNNRQTRKQALCDISSNSFTEHTADQLSRHRQLSQTATAPSQSSCACVRHSCGARRALSDRSTRFTR